MKTRTSTALCGLATGLLFLAAGISSSTAAITTVPTGLNPGDTYRLVFVTSTTRDALSTDIADYNNFVTSAANAVPELFSLGTTWSAIGTTATVSALANTGTDFTPAGIQGFPTFMLNDTKIANDYDELWTTNLLAPIRISENGDDVYNPSLHVYTGTSQQLGFQGRSQHPTTDLGTNNVILGTQNGGTSSWVGAIFGGSGSTLRPFYGISGELTVPIPEPSTALLSLVGLAAIGLRRRRS